MVGDIRGAGMMWSIKLVDSLGLLWSTIRSIRLACENHGVFVNTTLNGIMILPPITVTKAGCDDSASIIDQTLGEI